MTQGNTDAAKLYFEDAISLAQTSFGENHPDTAAAYDALAKYFLEMYDPEAALDYLKKAIEIRKNILAENHPDTAAIYYDLAMAQKETGDMSGATESLKRAKEICEKCIIQGALNSRIDEALES